MLTKQNLKRLTDINEKYKKLKKSVKQIRVQEYDDKIKLIAKKCLFHCQEQK